MTTERMIKVAAGLDAGRRAAWVKYYEMERYANYLEEELEAAKASNRYLARLLLAQRRAVRRLGHRPRRVVLLDPTDCGYDPVTADRIRNENWFTLDAWRQAIRWGRERDRRWRTLGDESRPRGWVSIVDQLLADEPDDDE